MLDVNCFGEECKKGIAAWFDLYN